MNLGPTSESLSPPDPDVDDSDEAVVEHEWDIAEVCLYRLQLRGKNHNLAPDLRKLYNSLQTIRELTEVRK